MSGHLPAPQPRILAWLPWRWWRCTCGVHRCRTLRIQQALAAGGPLDPGGPW